MAAYATPEEAEAAFYQAFNDRDIEAMLGVWASDDTIECIHPSGHRLRNRAEMSASWRAILGAGRRLIVRCADRTVLHCADLVVHTVHEFISIAGSADAVCVVATNAYRRYADGWRMVLHHAGPNATAPDEPSTTPSRPAVH